MLKFRASMDAIYDFIDQTVHFFTFTLRVYSQHCTFPFDNACASGWGPDAAHWIEILCGLIAFLQGIFAVGLRILGQKMIDPFGIDVEECNHLR